ncbi:zinc finger protein 90 homolog isoform X28 [Acanthochromis polyacanthus]|uniref:zinc finger protein 90 homolog isoform X28 n=1 Tax=Acanthochromis polyacanthus TaxID=80966 RepID=UPI0022342838|nr:zinc finger protein 90 homolog isoform X28 [Acanthochromis polyacanthus]
MIISSDEVTMTSVQNLRELINERLTAAAEEIFTEFEKTIVQYEEEIDRQRRLLDNIWKPQITQHTAALPQQHVCKEEKVLTDNQLNNQMMSSLHSKPPQIKEEQEELCNNVDQEEPELPQIIEEQNELCTSQDGEQLVLKQGINVFVAIPICEESDQNRINNSHSENVDNCAMSEGQCNTDNTEEKPVKCGICGKTFKFRCSLKKHHLSHTSERPYSCGICGKPFKSRCSLKKHHLSHTSEKPYTCETCGKCFNRSDSLKHHMVTHTGEKPYPCEICGKSFTLNRSFKVHMQLHTGLKPYSCETCGKSFALSYGLKLHSRVHTGEKPFSCKSCGRSFSQSCTLMRHMRIHK